MIRPTTRPRLTRRQAIQYKDIARYMIMAPCGLRILGLSWPCTLADVRASYRSLAKAHHPDAGGDPAHFRRLNQAYERLCQEPPMPKADNKRLFVAALVGGATLQVAVARSGIRPWTARRWLSESYEVKAALEWHGADCTALLALAQRWA